MTGQLRILLLEDSDADAELALRELSGAGIAVAPLRVQREDEFAAALSSFSPDLIVSDFSLPGFDGLSALQLARVNAPDVPFIFLSGTIGEERAVEAMRCGATDYVLKERLPRLPPVVTRAVKEADERRARHRAERQLAETRERLDGILASLVDVVWSRSVSPYSTLYVNAAAEALYHRAVSELYRNPWLWLEVVHPADRDEVARQWEQALQGAAFDAEYRIVREDGEVRWVHDHAQPVCDAGGKPARFDGLTRDITERKLNVEKIARLSRIRAVFSGINSAILRATDKSSLFVETCRIAVESGQFRMAWIGVPTPNRARVTPIASMGHEEGYLREVEAALAGLAEDPGGARRALMSKKPFVSNDILNDSEVRFKAEALARGYRSLIVLPILVEDEAVAVLSLYGSEPNTFDHEEIALLTEVADDISYALNAMAKEERLNYLAYYDVLTGLCNRHFLEVRLAQELAYEQRHRLGLTVLFADLDQFKVINDSLGHHMGDLLLRTVAARIVECVSPADIVARYGGDEFVVVLADQQSGVNASQLIQQLIEAVAKPIQVDGREFHTTCSIGVSVYPTDGTDAQTLLRNADAAMHRAKETGRHGFQYYAAEMNAAATERLLLNARLHRALQRSEFTLEFQPKVSVQDGIITGFEALMRWRHADLGAVSPARFIPVLEDSGLIVPVGEWAFVAATAQVRAWLDAGVHPVPIAVNVSVRQLLQADLDRRIRAILREFRVDPSLLEVEITESTLMSNAEQIARMLRTLQQMGVRVSVDDFGTGYSSLARLRSLPLDSLKVDRSFVMDVTTNSDAALITRAVISMAHSLRLKVVAEGVETAPQLAFLATSGCDEMQGFYFARPQPAEHCTRLLRERTRMDTSFLSVSETAPTVLIVEDDSGVRASLQRLLRRDGYRILTAGHAGEGFEALATNRVGVVIVDQRMPGMTGLEFLDRVRDLYPDTVRMVLSGQVDVKTISDAINRGSVSKFFTKPWNDDELREVIRAAFGLSRGSDSPALD